MILNDFYKDRPAIKLSDDEAEFMFLPEDGAKMVSFKYKGEKELFVQSDSKEYKRLFLDSDYVQAECSAFDDMFPTIDPCNMNGIEYVDHGEVCRREHDYEITEDSVKFSCYLPKLDIFYEKTASLKNGVLTVKYRIQNNNDFDFPYLWAAHMMFFGEDGATVFSNNGSGNLCVMFGDAPENDIINIYQTDCGKKSYKYYYTKPITSVKCGIIYPKSKIRVSVEFDGDVVKYFGAWMNIGKLNGLYNIALEPCTALYDSPANAKEGNAESVLKKNEAVEFVMKVSCDDIV